MQPYIIVYNELCYYLHHNLFSTAQIVIQYIYEKNDFVKIPKIIYLNLSK